MQDNTVSQLFRFLPESGICIMDFESAKCMTKKRKHCVLPLPLYAERDSLP